MIRIVFSRRWRCCFMKRHQNVSKFWKNIKFVIILLFCYNIIIMNFHQLCKYLAEPKKSGNVFEKAETNVIFCFLLRWRTVLCIRELWKNRFKGSFPSSGLEIFFWLSSASRTGTNFVGIQKRLRKTVQKPLPYLFECSGSPNNGLWVKS